MPLVDITYGSVCPDHLKLFAEYFAGVRGALTLSRLQIANRKNTLDGKAISPEKLAAHVDVFNANLDHLQVQKMLLYYVVLCPVDIAPRNIMVHLSKTGLFQLLVIDHQIFGKTPRDRSTMFRRFPFNSSFVERPITEEIIKLVRSYSIVSKMMADAICSTYIAEERDGITLRINAIK